jgi:predicted amidohydrolase
MTTMPPWPVAVVQMNSQVELAPNLARVEALCGEAAASGARLVVLPENFAYLGPEEGKRALAETLPDPPSELVDPGPIAACLSRLSRSHRLWILGGGMPERSNDEQRPYNTLAVFAPDGRLHARYRKIHLFDVAIGDGVTYCESAATSAGDEPVVTDIEGMRVGLSICYDLRFPELYRRLSAAGADVIVVPAAFTLMTGKDHWLVLLRARAIETQAYVLAAAQWGRHGKRLTYGKSAVIDPWGDVVAQAPEREAVVRATIDSGYLREVRDKLPALTHRRM